MKRESLVVGNWKMNPATVADAVALAQAVARGTADRVAVGVAPSFVALPAVAEALRGTKVRAYAQDVHWEERGAFTGQIAAAMLRRIATGAIVGHSEVRRDQGDDDARVARKFVSALRAGLHVILCVGEREADYLAGESLGVVRAQMAEPLRALRQADQTGALATRFAVAYEPVWAIGTGRAATAGHASSGAAAIRAAIQEEIGLDGDAVSVLYGGSVTAGGVAEFAAAAGIDGALVGGASLDAKEFAAIVRAFA